MPSTVTGIALLVLAAVLLGMSLAFVAAFRRGRRTLDAPRLVFTTVTAPVEGGGSRTMVDLAGRLTNPDRLSAPLTGDACAIWELTVLREQHGEDEVTYQPRWSTAASTDLTVAYEERRTGRSAPVAGPGEVEIAADQVRFSLPSGHPSLVFATGATQLRDLDADALAAYDPPAALLDEVRADPGQFRVTEAYLRHGDIVRLQQAPVAAGRPVPDPELPFQFHPLTQERITATGTGCLAVLLLVAAIAAGLGGLTLLR